MRLIASKSLLPLSAAFALFCALSLALAPANAQFGEQSGGIYSAGGASEGGGVWSSGGSVEGGGAAGNGSISEGGGVFNSGSSTQGGGVYNSGSSTEGGGFMNSGSSVEGGLGSFGQYVPPNPHAWSTYTGPKAPPAWGAPTLSASGGMVSAGSESEAKSSAPDTDSIDYSNIKADTASHVHYYGK